MSCADWGSFSLSFVFIGMEAGGFLSKWHFWLLEKQSKSFDDGLFLDNQDIA